MSAESTVGEELEGVVSSAVHVSIDSQFTLATLERPGEAEIGVPGTAVAARFGRSRFDGSIRHDDFAVSKRGVLKRFREFRHMVGIIVEMYPSNVGSSRDWRRKRVGRKEHERVSARAACRRASLRVGASATSNVMGSHDSSLEGLHERVREHDA